MGLKVHKSKTKYMLMARHTLNKNDLIVGLFEQIDNFKYFGTNINYKNDIHNEVKLRINSVNRIYFSLNKLLSSRMLSRVTK